MYHLSFVFVRLFIGSALFGWITVGGSSAERTHRPETAYTENNNYNGSDADLGPDRVTLTQVIFRNGDRSPLVTWPSDEFNSTTELGELTAKGKRRCYDLGRWLLSRYGNTSILQSGYGVSRTYIRSSDADRCIQCASALATGMFPPFSVDDRVRLDLDWQPVSIHSVPEEADRFLSEMLNCPAYHRAYAQLMQSTLFRQLHMKSKYLFREMSRNTGLKISKPAEALMVRDAMLIHESNNKTLSSWAKSISQCTELEQMYYVMHQASTYNANLARLRSGFLFKDILDRASGKSSQTVYMYSAHGSTITNLLNTLRMYNNQPVPYTAALLFESMVIHSEPYMRVLYLDDITTKPLPLAFPGCEQQVECPVRRLYQIYADIIPYKSFEEDCAAVYDEANVKSASFLSKVKRSWKKVFG